MDDLLALQTEITNRIANALGVELVNRERQAASNFGPVTSNQYLQFIVALCTL